MADITSLILDDHDTMRRAFAELDEPEPDIGRLADRWASLAQLLEVHAAAEEAVFYPRLLRRGAHGEDETEDAISDHNKIRDAIRAAEAEAAGSDGWWHAVHDARKENSDHMAEEERGALADFRQHADPSVRDGLGEAFLAFKRDRPDAGSALADKDPDRYIAEHGDG